MTVIFREPPPNNQAFGRLTDYTVKVIDAGMTNPGKWILLYEGKVPRHASTSFRKGAKWESCQRTEYEEGKRIYRTYVRYTGE